jgi:uncharacterized damage-inducible protein DinB
MSPEQATAILEFLHPQLVMESAVTRKVMASVPADRSDYRPDPKSMTAMELVRHIAFAEIWFLESIIQGKFTTPEDSGMSAFDTPDKVLAVYDERMPKLLDQLKSLSGEKLSEALAFFTWSFPAVTYVQVAQKHSVHHRGQLSTYLRPMGAKVPSIYGSSADEPVTTSAEA